MVAINLLMVPWFSSLVHPGLLLDSLVLVHTSVPLNQLLQVEAYLDMSGQ